MDVLRRRGRTVRSRFTILYAVLFLVSGTGLLVLTNLLGGSSSSEPYPGQVPPQDRVRLLEAQLENVRSAQSRQLLLGSLIALVVMAVVSVVLGNAVAGRVLRPLRTVTAATRRISAENLHERLAVPGPADEVKDLADTIDGLLERLEASFAAQRRFVANASHELRTPLATMRASLDVAVAKREPAAQTLALADRMRTELDQVDRLLEGLLVLARAQHSAFTDRVPVALDALAAEAITARAAAVAEKHLTLEGLQDTAWTSGDPTLLARMVENVVDNAIVHNHDGGWIRVTTGAGPAVARLVVESGGPVLDHVDRLAQPFQRLAPERTGSDTGSGLGLSIVAAIADAHGGHLDLHARADGGLRVTVSLPLGGRQDQPMSCQVALSGGVPSQHTGIEGFAIEGTTMSENGEPTPDEAGVQGGYHNDSEDQDAPTGVQGGYHPDTAEDAPVGVEGGYHPDSGADVGTEGGYHSDGEDVRPEA